MDQPHVSYNFEGDVSKELLLTATTCSNSKVVLVVVAALWRQIDFYCKELAPWEEMRKGPAAARVSLLLDYTSPIIPSALYEAFKNKHWHVAGSTIGFLLLKASVGRLCESFVVFS